jgi:hypothetical protein
MCVTVAGVGTDAWVAGTDRGRACEGVTRGVENLLRRGVARDSARDTWHDESIGRAHPFPNAVRRGSRCAAVPPRGRTECSRHEWRQIEANSSGLVHSHCRRGHPRARVGPHKHTAEPTDCGSAQADRAAVESVARGRDYDAVAGRWRIDWG